MHFTLLTLSTAVIAALGSHASPPRAATSSASASTSTSSSSATSYHCASTPLWKHSALTIRTLLTNAKPLSISSGTNHESHDRLLANVSSTRDWAFYPCAGPGIPAAQRSTDQHDGTIYGRLYDEGSQLCGTVDALPRNVSDFQIVWLEACRTAPAQAVRQLFSYNAFDEIKFVGDLAGKPSSQGDYVFDTRTDNYLPKYPLLEVGVRRLENDSSKHRIVKRVV